MRGWSEEEKVMDAWSLVKISRPSRGTGQVGIMRKECEKRWSWNWQAKGVVCRGVEGVPSIPVTEIWEGILRPE